ARFSRSQLSPDLAGGLDDEAKLRLLFLDGDGIALEGRGEAALRAQAQLLERDVFGGFVDATLQLVLLFERALLRRDQTQHHHLSLGHEAQGLEAARACVIIFEEEAIDLEFTEKRSEERRVGKECRSRW